MVVSTSTPMSSTTSIRMSSFKKKKLAQANRRIRERSRLSFLFVIFFFGLFSLIIVMESLMAEDKNMLKEEDLDGEGEDYSSWDISYEESPPVGVAPPSAVSSSSSSLLSRSTASHNNVNNNKNDNKIRKETRISNSVHPATIKMLADSLKQSSKQEGLQHVDSVSTLFPNNSINPINSNSLRSSRTNKKGTAGSTDAAASSSSLSSSSSASSSSSSSPRNIHPIQPDWQKVVGSTERFYVYSAYYNTVFDHIRIIGATRTKSTQRVQCRFYDNTTKLYASVDGSIRTIRENWNLKYSAVFIICYLPDRKAKPRYVSVMGSNVSPTSPASNILRVQYSKEKSNQLVDFAACVKPIHFNYNSVMNFLEWMEFHKLMGVQRFTFFNHTIGKEVSCIMREYGETIEVLPWSLPFVSQKEIRTEGLFAALNDCVYRHRGASKYLVLADLDEMIVPRKTQNYSMFIEQLDTLSNKKKIGAYSLQNAFFYLQWPNDQSHFKIEGKPLAEQVSSQLTMLRKTRRRSRLHPHKQRSKYICDPEKVIEAGNHFVWEMATGYFTLSVPPHLGTLHHYRVCEFGGDQCIKSPSIVDKSAHIFGQKLAIRVAERLQAVVGKCQLDIKKLLKKTNSEKGTTAPAKIKMKVKA